MSTISYAFTPTPIGTLLLVQSEAGLLSIRFEGRDDVPEPGWIHNPAALSEVIRQRAEYFDGQRQTFDLPLAPAGTPFQQEVWQALRAIPYGETVSYGEIARQIGKPDAVRAVGAANGKNPIPIIVPCHRVIGSNGTLTGYAGGLSIKEALLALEHRITTGQAVQLTFDI